MVVVTLLDLEAVVERTVVEVLQLPVVERVAAVSPAETEATQTPALAAAALYAPTVPFPQQKPLPGIEPMLYKFNEESAHRGAARISLIQSVAIADLALILVSD